MAHLSSGNITYRNFPSDMPNPEHKDLSDPVFNAIWEVIKSWDINAPEYYHGYCGGNGSHVMLILNALRESDVIR